MASTYPVGIKLDKDTIARLDRLGALKDRSRHWLMKEAVCRYLEQEEAAEQARQETLERWERYQMTGEQVSNDAMMAWLATWGTDEEGPCPTPGT